MAGIEIRLLTAKSAEQLMATNPNAMYVVAVPVKNGRPNVVGMAFDMVTQQSRPVEKRRKKRQ